MDASRIPACLPCQNDTSQTDIQSASTVPLGAGRKLPAGGTVGSRDNSHVRFSCRHVLFQLLDRTSRCQWRLVDRLSSKTVYECTTALVPWSEVSFLWPCPATDDGALPLPLIHKCSGLRSLSCKGMSSLRCIQGLPPGLQVLDLTGTCVTDISPLHHQGSSLQELALSSVYGAGFRNPKTCATLPTSPLSACVNLHKLHIHDIYLKFYVDDLLASSLLRIAQLRELRLTRLHLQGPRGFDRVSTLAAAMGELHWLQLLSLQGSRIGHEGAAQLAPAIEALTQLQHLDRAGNTLMMQGARALAPALATLTGLRSLDLSNNHLCAGGIAELLPAVLELNGLCSLSLECNNLGADGAQELEPLLMTMGMQQLQHLNLRDNNLGGVAAMRLGPSIEMLHHLQDLDLSGNHIGAWGAAALAPTIASLTNLQHLMISLKSGTRKSFLACVRQLRREMDPEAASTRLPFVFIAD